MIRKKIIKRILSYLLFTLILHPVSGQILPFNNPSFIENSPSISPGGKQLIYASLENNQWKVYISEAGTTGWSAPVPLETLNKHLEAGKLIEGLSFSKDGRFIIFSANFSDSEGGMDIYMMEKIPGGWSDPLNLGQPVNSINDESSPSLGPRNNELFFTRPNFNSPFKDIPCKRILHSVKQNNGKWNAPAELPQHINTGCVTTPFICADGRVLIYAAMTEENKKSGFNLYYSQQIVKDAYTLPKIIDTLVHEQDVTYPSVPLAGDQIYFLITDSKKPETGSQIAKHTSSGAWNAAMPLVVEGTVTNGEGKTITDVPVKLSDPYTYQERFSTSTFNGTGNFRFILDPKVDYLADFHKPGYSHFFMNLPGKFTKDELKNAHVSLFDMISLVLNIYDAEIYQPVDGVIKIADTGNEINIKPVQTGKGRYEINLPVGRDFFITIEAPNYETLSDTFSLARVVQYAAFERDIEMIPQKEEFEIFVADEETQEGMEVEIVITNLEKNETIVQKASVNKQGKYVVKLRKGDKYEINVNSPKGYAFYNTTVDLDSEKEKKLDVELKPLKAMTQITLNNISFETNSADLNESSYAELNRVVKLMVDNPGIKIEISAHTDDIGSNDYNLKLSDKRAKSVVNYLENKNIPVERLLFRGYGEEKPLTPNTSDENRAKNRRVELKIVDINENE